MNDRDEFEKILANIQIAPNIPRDKLNEQLNPILQFVNANLPNALFKFRGCEEYSLDAFEKKEIWLSTASLFNDPNDSILYFDKASIGNYLDELDKSGAVISIIEALSQKKLPLEQIKLSTDNVGKWATNLLNSSNKSELRERFSKFIPQIRLYIDNCFSEITCLIRDRVKMACFSENIKSPLMWAHYANSNKGFALRYDFRNNSISQCSNCPNRSCSNILNASIYPIIYGDTRFDATDFGVWYIRQKLSIDMGLPLVENYNDELFFFKAVLHKSSDWKYEEEWRIICTTPNQALEIQNRYPIKKKPDAIYFGCQISDVYRNMLSRIADEEGYKKYQMYVKNDSPKYELDFFEV